MDNTAHTHSDKRRAIRITPEPGLPIGVHLIGEDYVEITTATNISMDGIGIYVPHGFQNANLDNLAEVLVKLPEPVDYSFITTVKIAHRNENHFGAQFQKIEKKDSEKLNIYIQKIMNVRMDRLKRNRAEH